MFNKPFIKVILLSIVLFLVLFACVRKYTDVSGKSENEKGIEDKTALSATDVITVYYFQRQPYYSTLDDGDVSGFLLEITKLFLDEADISYHFEECAVKRILVNVETEKQTCSVGWFKNEERKKKYKFTDPIYQNKPMIAIVNKAKRNLLSGSPDIDQILNSELELIVIDGFSYGDYIDINIRKHNPEVIKAMESPENIINMIALGRADYTFLAPEEAGWIINNDEYLTENLDIVKIEGAPEGNFRYLLFNNDTDPSLIEKIDETIRKISKTEVYRDLAGF